MGIVPYNGGLYMVENQIYQRDNLPSAEIGIKRDQCLTIAYNIASSTMYF